MTREEAQERIKSIPIPMLFSLEKTPKAGINKYACPLCDSGKGNSKTGGFEHHPDKNDWCCRACHRGGDAFTLYEYENGLPTGAEGFPQALEGLAKMAGFILDEPAGPPKPRKKDNREYYEECHLRLAKSQAAQDYLQGRKISIATAAEYKIGFDPVADPAESNHPCARIIIPVTKEHYIARAIDPNTPPGFAKMNPKGAKIGIWNIQALWKENAQEVFVVEGAFDALSVIEAGGEAIALNSTSNVEKLIEAIKAKKPKCKLILCLDSDKAGKSATDLLQKDLKTEGIPFITADINCGHKDPNEALQKSEGRFREAVLKAISEVRKPNNTSLFLDRLFQAERERDPGKIATGFPAFDKQTNGGLYAGLYMIAAGTSAGKTTFCLQMADSLARSGQEVIFFTMEQSRLELVCKSLARIAYLLNKDTRINADRIRHRELSNLEEAELKPAIAAYKEQMQDRLSIVEGNFNFTINNILEEIREHINRTGKSPVVFIDYLQLLKPASEKDRGIRETVDAATTELKILSRNYGVPIIAISSISRANYYNALDLDSFKESGGIEYTADTVFVLQMKDMHDPVFEKDKATNAKRERVKAGKRKAPREMELVCCKNRFGSTDIECEYKYHSAHDYFEEFVFLNPSTETAWKNPLHKK